MDILPLHQGGPVEDIQGDQGGGGLDDEEVLGSEPAVGIPDEDAAIVHVVKIDGDPVAADFLTPGHDCLDLGFVSQKLAVTAGRWRGHELPVVLFDQALLFRVRAMKIGIPEDVVPDGHGGPCGPVDLLGHGLHAPLAEHDLPDRMVEVIDPGEEAGLFPDDVVEDFLDQFPIGDLLGDTDDGKVKAVGRLQGPFRDLVQIALGLDAQAADLFLLELGDQFFQGPGILAEGIGGGQEKFTRPDPVHDVGHLHDIDRYNTLGQALMAGQDLVAFQQAQLEYVPHLNCQFHPVWHSDPPSTILHKSPRSFVVMTL